MGKLLAIKSHLDFLESCDEYHYINSCDINLSKPMPHLSVTVGDSRLTRWNNFRISLLVGCAGLEHNAKRFRTITNEVDPKDSTCKLCRVGVEDVEHFIASCTVLQQE